VEHDNKKSNQIPLFKMSRLRKLKRILLVAVMRKSVEEGMIQMTKMNPKKRGKPSCWSRGKRHSSQR